MLQPHASPSHASQSAGLGPRSVGIGFVVTLHVVAIYALATSIGVVTIKLPQPPISARIIDVGRPEPLPPPPLVPQAPPPQIPIPSDPVIIDIAPPVAGDPITVPQPEPPIVSPVPERIAPVEITPAVGIEGTHSIPEYPILSRRLGEQGTVRLFLTIGEDGMVSAAAVRRSSGSLRLDAAAVDWVLKHWRYRPAMRGAMPIASSAEAALTFRLH